MTSPVLVGNEADSAISTVELHGRLDDPELTIVDVRPCPPTTAGG